jgi:hypothetical protein
MVNITTTAGIIGLIFNSVVKKQQQKLQKIATFFFEKTVDQYCPKCYNMGIHSNKEHEMFLLGLIVGIVVGAYLAIVVIVHTQYLG